MDCWNPIIAEEHIKRIPLREVVLGYVVAGAALLAGTWVVAVLILSLEAAL